MLAVCAPVPVTRLSGSASGTCFAGCALHYRQRAGELGLDDHQPFVGDAGIDDFLAALFPVPLSPLSRTALMSPSPEESPPFSLSSLHPWSATFMIALTRPKDVPLRAFELSPTSTANRFVWCRSSSTR